MKVRIIAVPYDSGHAGERMGRGPLHFIEQGVEGALRERGHEVVVERVETNDPFPSEVKTSFELYRRVSERVRAVASEGAFPLVLSGNCGSALGTVSGLDLPDLGVIWFDAHGDFNTPETSPSGFLDGMCLATLSGSCWREVARTIPGFRPVPERNIVHVGGRDLDPGERTRFEGSQVTVIGADQIEAEGVGPALAPVLQRLRDHAGDVYVHLDLDVLDAAEAPANQYASGGGISVGQAEEALQAIGSSLRIRAGAISAYDPTYDPDDRALEAGLRLIQQLVALAA